MSFKPIGGELTMAFQLKTFQGVRYALFHYNTGGSPGGQADFDKFTVDEPRPRGLTQPIPIRPAHRLRGSGDRERAGIGGRKAALGRKPSNGIQGRWTVDEAASRCRLRAGQYLSVAEAGIEVTSARPGDAEKFQWVDLQRGDTLLLSVATHRYVVVPNTPGPARADHPGPAPDRKNGPVFNGGYEMKKHRIVAMLRGTV